MHSAVSEGLVSFHFSIVYTRSFALHFHLHVALASDVAASLRPNNPSRVPSARLSTEPRQHTHL
jgi:hypothetical protein